MRWTVERITRSALCPYPRCVRGCWMQSQGKQTSCQTVGSLGGRLVSARTALLPGRVGDCREPSTSVQRCPDLSDASCRLGQRPSPVEDPPALPGAVRDRAQWAARAASTSAMQSGPKMTASLLSR